MARARLAFLSKTTLAWCGIVVGSYVIGADPPAREKGLVFYPFAIVVLSPGVLVLRILGLEPPERTSTYAVLVVLLSVATWTAVTMIVAVVRTRWPRRA